VRSRTQNRRSKNNKKTGTFESARSRRTTKLLRPNPSLQRAGAYGFPTLEAPCNLRRSDTPTRVYSLIGREIAVPLTNHHESVDGI
jgi:hypothetical protein